jgi:hypothetical protein
MRTTLDIDDAILAAAKEIAEASNSSAGAVISDLARKGLTQTPGRMVRKRSGFPVFAVPSDAKPLTASAVKSILSDEGLPARR